MDTKRIPVSGDPFYAAAPVDQDHPHACLGDGYVYLGYTTVDEETGEEAEVVDCVSCRGCENSR